ncbi:MAG: aldose epimerase family protein, partial [Chloroflexota bacterium]
MPRGADTYPLNQHGYNALMVLPTGRHFRIGDGPRSAAVVELGAGLRQYWVGDREVLDGYAEAEPATGARGMPLLPWPNRVEDGRYTFEGQDLQLPINQVGEHNAIHGLTRWVPWAVVEKSPSRVAMATTIYPQPGYPFTLALRVAYEVSDEGLAVETTARNEGAVALPYGAGQHPYLAVAGGRVDRAGLTVPASARFPSDRRGLPQAEEAVAGTIYDFRASTPIGDLVLDDCYSQLQRDADGRARVRVDGTTLWVDDAYRFLMLFTGESLPNPAQRR